MMGRLPMLMNVAKEYIRPVNSGQTKVTLGFLLSIMRSQPYSPSTVMRPNPRSNWAVHASAPGTKAYSMAASNATLTLAMRRSQTNMTTGINHTIRLSINMPNRPLAIWASFSWAASGSKQAIGRIAVAMGLASVGSPSNNRVPIQKRRGKPGGCRCACTV